MLVKRESSPRFVIAGRIFAVHRQVCRMGLKPKCCARQRSGECCFIVSIAHLQRFFGDFDGDFVAWEKFAVDIHDLPGAFERDFFAAARMRNL